MVALVELDAVLIDFKDVATQPSCSAAADVVEAIAFTISVLVKEIFRACWSNTSQSAVEESPQMCFWDL